MDVPSYDRSHPVRARLAAAAAALLLLPSGAHAQFFPSVSGFGARVGVASPEQADAGFSVSADLDLGALRTPRLRTFVGLNYFTADAARTQGNEQVKGGFSAIGGHAGLRLDLLDIGRVTPYLLAELSGHQVSAGDVNQPDTRRLLEGFYVGAGAGGGVAWHWSETGGSSVVVEGRRVAANNIDRWVGEIGLRFERRRPEGDELAARDAALERERLRIAAERTRTQAEAQRQEAERAAAERAASERAAAELAAQQAERARAAEQRAVRTAAETADSLSSARAARDAAMVQAAAEAERLRQERAAAEAATAREAQARRAAEAEAAAAREQAAAAGARANAAEQRLQETLRELTRSSAAVTDVRETDRGLIVVLGATLFSSGQSELSTGDRGAVQQIATVLAQTPGRTVRVEGHTDAVGGDTSNQRLSEERANAVRAALIAGGLDPARVTAVGYGESRPVAGNDTAEGRARNRRVELVVVADGSR